MLPHTLLCIQLGNNYYDNLLLQRKSAIDIRWACMQSLHSIDLVRYIAAYNVSLLYTAQSQCVPNLPIFADQGGRNVERLQSGTHAIIPDYSFDCYGNVTQWGAFVEGHGGDIRYTLDFQVWRRNGGGLGPTGNYDFVGNNRFPSIDPPGGPQRGQIDKSVPVEDQIRVRPGDVIGLYITTSGNNGVELEQQDTSNGDVVVIWFATSLPAALESTRIRVGSISGYELTSTTTAAPVITAVVVPSTPSPSPTPSPSSPGFPTKSVLSTTSTVQPPPVIITQTSTSQTTAPSTPQASSFLVTTSPPVGSGLELGVIVAIVIVVLIVVVLGVLILVFILALALRRSKKQVLMVNSFNNPEYSGKLEIMHWNEHLCIRLIET